jgi:GTPase SAR1 family protein
VIAVVEGPSAAGKTTWCRRFFPEAMVGESPPTRAEGQLPVSERHAIWLEMNCGRWQQALAAAKSVGFAVCDTDPFKLHYTWSLWQLGEVEEAEWELAAEENRRAFTQQRLGIADLILVDTPPAEELRRRRETDRRESGRQRNAFALHQRLAECLRDWYEAVERLDAGRVRWGLPQDGVLDPLPPIRHPRSGVEMFDALLAELPTRPHSLRSAF